MKNIFTSETLENVWLKALQSIVLHGKNIPEKESFLEIRNLQITYRNAFETDSYVYKNNFGTKWLDYMTKVYSPKGDPETGRNYYKLIHEQDEIDQVVRVIKILSEEPLSRSAIIVLSTVKKEKKPCVTEIAFSVRDGYLHMSVVFKSSDFAKKFIPDMVELSNIHRKISQEIHVPRGEISAFILTAQVYQDDIVILQKMFASLKKSSYFKTVSVIENWNKEAEEWDVHVKDPNHYVNFENGYSRFLKFINDKIPNTKRSIALDSGCGTGIISEVLKDKGYKTIGLDIAPKMLDFAHKKKDIKYFCANSLDIPYPNNYFDLVCSRGVLISHVGKKYVDLFINEHKRVLKSGGIFMFDFITHFNKEEIRKKKKKASITYKNLSKIMKDNGFELLARSGEDFNRVNAIICKKI